MQTPGHFIFSVYHLKTNRINFKGNGYATTYYNPALCRGHGNFRPRSSSFIKVRPDAPQRYVVKNGDTLWGISGKYLYSPWQWNRLWGANRGEIRNPHLIYPGQVLVYATSTASRDWVLSTPKPVQTAFP